MKQLNNNPETAAVKTSRGFSLIELLVVIAIIALLAAIIFPVFATVRENGRQQTSISNLHDISTKLEQFKLDHKTYPSVLFGRAYPPSAPVAMDKAYAQALADDTANGSTAAVDQYFDGLYPEYVRDVNSFTDGNNPTKDLAAVTVVPTVKLNDDKTISVVNTTFYTMDAYDSSPLITGTNKVDQNTNVQRYSPTWTSITASGNAPASLTTYLGAPETTFDTYKRQLRWQNPPSSTYVASTTYHVPYSNKVIVLWQNGAAKSIDASLFTVTGGGTDTQSVIGEGPDVTSAKFWQLKQP